MRSKVTPRKVGIGLKRRRELNKRRLGWRLAWWGSTEKEASQFLGLRGRHQYSDQRKRAADGRRQRSREIIDEEREKCRAKNVSLRNTSTDSKGATFVILINHESVLDR